VRLGVVILPEHRWADAAPRWRRAEELGLHHAWTYDHLAWRSFRESAWFAAVPQLSAAAAATERIRVGTLVASPNFRHPLPFAKDLIALDDIADGRLTLGIGSGGVGWDATMLGQAPWPPAERAGRFEEFVDLLDRLLREPEVTSSGRWYSVDEARTYPGCVQQPRVPFAVAAVGPRAMAVAARFGQAWVTTGDRTDEPLDPPAGAALVAQQSERLDEACAAAGRDPAEVDRMVLLGVPLAQGLGSVEEFRDAVGRYEEAGVTDLVVHWPRDDEPYAGDVATFEAAVTAVVGP
jgi:alkanesulfonate monooxygenase SsuD/methylene tetrahydromethanopterin reductase-like flavin-dependent oxidoreductase (luciferase family)